MFICSSQTAFVPHRAVPALPSQSQDYGGARRRAWRHWVHLKGEHFTCLLDTHTHARTHTHTHIHTHTSVRPVGVRHMAWRHCSTLRARRAFVLLRNDWMVVQGTMGEGTNFTSNAWHVFGNSDESLVWTAWCKAMVNYSSPGRCNCVAMAPFLCKIQCASLFWRQLWDLSSGLHSLQTLNCLPIAHVNHFKPEKLGTAGGYASVCVYVCVCSCTRVCWCVCARGGRGGGICVCVHARVDALQVVCMCVYSVCVCMCVCV